MENSLIFFVIKCKPFGVKMSFWNKQKRLNKTIYKLQFPKTLKLYASQFKKQYVQHSYQNLFLIICI